MKNLENREQQAVARGTVAEPSAALAHRHLAASDIAPRASDTEHERTTSRHSRRTHTCGELTAADCRQGRRPAGLGPPRPRSRRASCSSTCAIVRHHPGGRPRRGAQAEIAKRLRPEVRRRHLGRVTLRAKEAVNPKIKTGEIEVAAADIRC
jgi:hypothetical protein